jgi:RNA polymerase sigma factor (sigma-70 family)
MKFSMAAENLLFNASERPLATETVEQRFAALMEQHGPSLARLAAAYTNTVSDRDDLFQEIAISIWQALPTFRGESSERTFIYRIAHNRALTHLARRPNRQVDLAEDAAVRDPQPDPEQQVAIEQQRDRLLRAIRRLPADYRRVIVLVLEGLSHNEVAEILGLNANNVAVRVNRAKQMLRDSLKEGL